MTDSEVAATEAHAPKWERWRRPALITAALVIPHAALLAQVQRTGLCALHLEFCKYRGSFHQVGVPFLLLGAIAVPCWLLFRLYRRRRTARPPSIGREILLLTAVVYLL